MYLSSRRWKEGAGVGGGVEDVYTWESAHNIKRV
jgi:hypothetical protein